MSKLPAEVRQAQRVYRNIKEAYGVCTVLACTRDAMPGYVTCERCRSRFNAAQARFDARKRESLRASDTKKGDS